MKVRDIIEPNVLNIIGNGISTKLWLDRWHYEGVLVKRFGENIRHMSGLSMSCNVALIMENGTWIIGGVTTTMLAEVWNSLPQIDQLLANQLDVIVWTARSNGCFPQNQHGMRLDVVPLQLIGVVLLGVRDLSLNTALLHGVCCVANFLPNHSYAGMVSCNHPIAVFAGVVVRLWNTFSSHALLLQKFGSIW